MCNAVMVDKFVDYLRYELKRSERTVNEYADDLRKFETYFRSLDTHLSWKSIDADVVRDWMEKMIESGNTATSVNRRLSALRTFYRFALARGMVNSDPVHSVLGPKRRKPIPQFLKENEIDDLIDRQKWSNGYEDVRARTIILLFYETGMRLSELIGLDDSDVNFLNREIKVTGKRNKQRVIPFGEELENTLREYVEIRNDSVERQSSALILSDKGERMKPYRVRSIVKENISRVSSLKKRSPHVLRHTFATVMLNHEAGIESLKQLLGHASISTTEIYTHTTFEQLKRVYINAHPRA